MEYGKLIGDSFEYTKEGLFKNLGTWILLIILAILPVIPFIFVGILMVPSLMAGTMPDIPTLIGGFAVAFLIAIILGAFYMGYLVKIFRGETPLPAVSGFGKLFIDGIKYLIIEVIYFIPVLIILAVTAGAAIMAALPTLMEMPSEPNLDVLMPALMPIIGGVIIGIIIAAIVAIILWLFAIVGIVRFARTGRIGEAFNFSAILTTIGKIGWGTYILALIVMAVLVTIVVLIIGLIPYIGGFIQLIISPFISIFSARYICLLYDSAGETVSPGGTDTL
jgi:amino acid transporter